MRCLRSVQVLRGVAACAVVFLHARTGFELGAAGVDIFFAISGFIMASIPKGPSFLFDRIWRIYPMWLIAVMPWIASSKDWQTVVTSLTLWPLWGKMTLPALGIGWTLSFEMLFYCSIALSLRFGVKPLLAIFIVMLSGAVITHAPIFSYFGNPMIFEFLFGVLIAKLPKYSAASAPLLVLALVLLLLSPTWMYPADFGMTAPRSAWRVAYWGVPSALILYACVSSEHWFERKWSKLPFLLGNASYSIYLFHLTVIKSLHANWLVAVLAAVLVGMAMWYFIERNILKLKPRQYGAVAPVVNT